MYKISKTLPMFDTQYQTQIPAIQIYTETFDKLPSQYEGSEFYTHSALDYFLHKNYCVILNNNFDSKRVKTLNENAYLLLNKENHVMVILSCSRDNKDKSYRAYFYYDYDFGNIKHIINFDELNKFRIKKKKSNINLVISMHGSLDAQEYDLRHDDIDLELNYGKSFINIHNTIVKRLNKLDDKGIVLLHGEPGTGKTSYLKYLTSLIKEKEILFIPPSMAESLSEPNIIPFLMEYKNSILIIEDAEKVISDREFNGSAAGVSNILNLTDGILSDCLSIQVIATFNMKKEKIDRALLRKGRLIAEHKFTSLNVDESNKLLKHLNKNFVTDCPMTLSDIYNIDVDYHKSKQFDVKIGFK